MVQTFSRTRSPRPIWLIALGLMGVIGCGASRSTVTGSVSYEGSPVETGQITFTPSDGKGSVSGSPITGGTYSVEGVTPGKKVVRIEAFKKVNFASSSQEMMDKANEQKRRGIDTGLVDPADIMPDNAEGNHQIVELVAGSNRKDFALTKPKKSR
jgi:hypothetical protein